MQGFFQKRPDIRLICLVRNNTLRRYLSAQQLDQTRIVKVRNDLKNSTLKMNVDVCNIIDRLNSYDADTAGLLSLAKRHPPENTFRIDYELFFDSSSASQQQQISQLLTFLGVEDTELSTEHKRIRPRNLRDGIANFEELTSALVGTKYERWLIE